MAAPSFTQLEELIGRIPLDETNYWVFEKLLRQPYDVYRPIMDMLFDGTIVVEDLTVPTGSTSLASQSDVFSSLSRLTVDSSPDVLHRRCVQLIAGSRPGAVVISRDTSALDTALDGSVGPSYTPVTNTEVGADSSVISPNAIELARASSLVDAQKAAQAALAAALEPKIG